ncbi:EPIDERMAL PATTERNING FACTOR-like protein 4 [Impatiens glandulifera]|uniref:EPIDERMAL PATTERNING FACTOR-like protein 4 n=1 Tax=Impatiens glandulifera TaxID=253017 RepID=UPI001FB16613|nr:EPIDERMAL PATTERNING FACTOR-like protein 4 [Impatiens glandulifera]
MGAVLCRLRRRQRSIHISAEVTFIFICCLLLASSSSSYSASSIRLINNSIPKPGVGGVGGVKASERRRLVGGLGSWPPACKSKCGICSPCDAVHVPIQPGFSTPQEYYPEAWRCKCGNKLFMP